MPTTDPSSGAMPSWQAAIARSPGCSCLLPRVGLDAVLIEIAAVAVVDDDGREPLDLEAANGFRAQIFVGYDFHALHEARKQSPGAADGAEVDAFVLLEGVLDRLRARALAHGGLEAQLDQRRRELVHAAAGGGADRPDDVPRPGRRRAGVVDDLTPDVDRQLFALLDQRPEAPVRRVARSVYDSVDPHPVARPEGLDVRIAQRCRDVLEAVGRGGDAHRQETASTMAFNVGLGRIAFDVSSRFGRKYPPMSTGRPWAAFSSAMILASFS